jgi:hypothetical protein
MTCEQSIRHARVPLRINGDAGLSAAG